MHDIVSQVSVAVSKVEARRQAKSAEKLFVQKKVFLDGMETAAHHGDQRFALCTFAPMATCNCHPQQYERTSVDKDLHVG